MGIPTGFQHSARSRSHTDKLQKTRILISLIHRRLQQFAKNSLPLNRLFLPEFYRYRLFQPIAHQSLAANTFSPPTLPYIWRAAIFFVDHSTHETSKSDNASLRQMTPYSPDACEPGLSLPLFAPAHNTLQSPVRAHQSDTKLPATRPHSNQAQPRSLTLYNTL